ncbi:hypothetical protein [Streptomyces sp. NPDC015131]|uniref:hypothetical protein n=1 Tax=Streptomyces sp. NPDC015131 TaxID=3364941 RepID=UPI0036F4EBED
MNAAENSRAARSPLSALWTGRAWWSAPVRLVLAGVVLMSVLSHGFDGGHYLVVMLTGGLLQLTGLVWASAAWRTRVGRRARTGPGTGAAVAAPGGVIPRAAVAATGGGIPGAGRPGQSSSGVSRSEIELMQ